MTSGGWPDRSRRFLVGGVARRAHHRRAAGRVDVDHPDAEPRGRGDRAGDGVRDVVELQVEEHAIAAADQLFDERRAVAGEQPAADLEAADRAAQRVGERARLVGGVDVERDEELIHHAVLPCAPSRHVERADEVGDARRCWWRCM